MNKKRLKQKIRIARRRQALRFYRLYPETFFEIAKHVDKMTEKSWAVTYTLHSTT